MFGVSLVANGQSLSGTILDKDRDPLIGAHILNGTNHTHSDENGYFELQEIGLNDTLNITYVGFQSRKVIIRSYEDIEIVLDDDPASLDEVVISSGTNILNEIIKVDLQTSPVNSSQEILNYIPGLFLGQHAGGGKAEQIFLRGFDIDHGTDLAISVDHMPVNMVSHAHGQGYADLHFLIPETIRIIEFGKGPYYADQGNFNTAGYVNFRTKEMLESSVLKIEMGDFNTNRILGMFNLPGGTQSGGYMAVEKIETDGPFESPQDFARLNVLGTYTIRTTRGEKIRLQGSHFTSQWNASGQIPIRAVEDGSITRFGAIDDTEGGRTNRQNISIDWGTRIGAETHASTTIFYSRYAFELYSNFTFFLEDPINGDQIRQKESRNLFGFKSVIDRRYSIGNVDGNLEVGLELRNDFIADNELSYTRNRIETLRPVQFGDIMESDKSLFFNAGLETGKWELEAGIRGDLMRFSYTGQLASQQAKAFQILTINPKLSIQYNHSATSQFYLKAGRGFHSNDSRTVIENIEHGQTIPGAYGLDLGTHWKPWPHVFLNAALWHLEMENEFVYVGDAGIVEPSGSTRRQGVDLTFRYQFFKWLMLNSDATFTRAQSLNVPTEEKEIPLAPSFTFTSGLHLNSAKGWYGSLSLRHMGDRPANESNTIIAKGYTIVDAKVGYQWKKFDAGLEMQNLLDSEWNETQFATESRLRYEAESVEEIHFTPGAPLYIKGSIQYSF